MTTFDYASQAQIGDVIFIRIPAYLFSQVADTTLSWTNHVGVVVDIQNGEPIVAESCFPFSKRTTWSKFLRRSEQGRVAIKRLQSQLNVTQCQALNHAVNKRTGVFYDTGFNLYSKRQFCSRFVREVIAESLGVQLGTIENFDVLLKKNPKTNLTFWNVWYFGNIPWQRETVSPASLLNDSQLHMVFDGLIH